MSGERQALLVLGMHRSGTSAVAGALVKLGATPPRTPMEGNPHNPFGFFESVPAMKFHDELLQSAGTHWNDWRAFAPAWHATPAAAEFRQRAGELLDAEFGDSRLFVLKDPRICRFVSFWLHVLRDKGIVARPVLLLRLPLEVAFSLRVREGFPFAQSFLLWLRHMLDAEAATRGLPRAIVPYHSLLADWRHQIELIARNAEVDWPARSHCANREIDAFLNSALRHHECSTEEGRRHPDMHPWIMSAYEACIELAADPGAASVHATLDRIRARFDEAADLFGRLFRHHGDGELYQLRLALEEQTDTARRANKEVVSLRTGLELERQASEKARDQAADLTGVLEAERHALKRAIDESLDLRGALAAERDTSTRAGGGPRQTGRRATGAGGGSSRPD